MLLPDLPWPLSFLQLNDYINCQRKCFHKHVAKDAVEHKSGQQRSGIEVHDAFKRRIKFNEPLPPELAQHEGAILPILARPGEKHVELGLGATADGRPCGFFDSDCRLRGRIDVCVLDAPAPAKTCFICDWKTGKPWEDPLELKIQALLLRIHYPDLQTIIATYYWLRENRVGKLHNVSRFEDTWNAICRWTSGMKNCMDTGIWQPDENPLCSWCPCSKQQCEFKKDRAK